MRRKKIEGILCLTGMLLLTGCGTKAYDLTEAEESQIVNYAVHVVTLLTQRKSPESVALQ